MVKYYCFKHSVTVFVRIKDADPRDLKNSFFYVTSAGDVTWKYRSIDDIICHEIPITQGTSYIRGGIP